MIGRVTWTDYKVDDELGVLVRLSARLANGERWNGYVAGTEPYIFAPEDEPVPDRYYIERTESGYESLFDDQLQKIVTRTPKQAGGLTDEFSWTGEGDVPYYRRVAIHDGLSGYVDIPEADRKHDSLPVVHIDDIDVEPEFDEVIEPRISIADIEVHVPEDGTFNDMTENGSEPINVICSYDTYEEEYTVFYYDKYGGLDAENIRGKMAEQLSGTGIEEYTDSDIELVVSDSEVGMLNEYVDYIDERDFDLESGWNWTDFDRTYIRRRMKTLYEQDENIHPSWLSPFGIVSDSRSESRRIPGRAPFDMMEAFCDKLTFSNWRSKSLEYVANEELGIGKIEDVHINDDWENNPSRLIAYNIVDVVLTVALDDVNDIHNFFYEMADVSCIPIYDVFYEKRIVDGIVLDWRDNNEILPTADESELVDNAGGYVADAIKGRKQDIGVSDLKSLYPSVIITWNLSTETVAETPEDFDDYVKIPKVPEPKNVSGTITEDMMDWDWLYASLDQEGLIPRVSKNLFKKRNYEKEQMYAAPDGSQEEKKWERKQGATKVIMNSIYGNLSSKYFRLANEYLGDAVTSTARYTLWKGEQTIDRLGYEHIYSDTDSHFIQLTRDTLEGKVEELEEISAEMDADASEIAQEIGIEGEHPYLKNEDLHGDEYTCLLWEPEKIYSAFMQLGNKKRYAGNIKWKEGTVYDDVKISISGFENQRSDSMLVTADLQENIIEMILTNEDFVTVSEYLSSIISDIDIQDDDAEKFALPGSINKDLEDYPNRQIPRACMWSNEHLDSEFGEGDDPFVYLVSDTPSGLPQTDVVAFEWDEEIPEGFELDKEAIIERGIKKPIDSIINEMDWKFQELRSGKRQKKKDLSTGGSNPFA